MTPQGAAGLRCPVCQGALLPLGNVLRCPTAHSFDLAKEGYANLVPLRQKHTASPGDDKQMVRARRTLLGSGVYAPFMREVTRLCEKYAPDCRPARIVDAGCGEGSYDKFLFDAMNQAGNPPVLIGFDVSKEAVRLAAKLLPQASFCVGGSYCAPVRDGWADIVVNIFSPFAGDEFCRMLCPDGVLIYAVPTARHLYGLKEILYENPYENEEKQTVYSGFDFVEETAVTDTVTVAGETLQSLFAMTPYFWKTPAEGKARLAAADTLTTEIGFRFLVYRKK